jgi:hypothetical protein
MMAERTEGTVRTADGTSIAFERAGTGAALILVDGALSFRGFGPMGPLGARLASRFTVYTYDRRGRGESTDMRPYAVEREIEDIEALIEEAGGSAGLYGTSPAPHWHSRQPRGSVTRSPRWPSTNRPSPLATRPRKTLQRTRSRWVPCWLRTGAAMPLLSFWLT